MRGKQKGLRKDLILKSNKLFIKHLARQKVFARGADAQSKLFRFRSGTHGLNVEKVIKNVSCVHMVMSVRVSVMCCGSVQHNYSSSRADFLLKLQEKLRNGFERFYALQSNLR